jgi:hypothetical protein
MAEVRVLKFDAGSITDDKLGTIQRNLHAGTAVEAFRRSVAIAEFVTTAVADGKKVLIQQEDGSMQELVLG